MTEKLFEEISAGALVVIALLILVVIARLGRLEKTIRARSTNPEAAQSTQTGETPAVGETEAPASDDGVDAAATSETSLDEEGPYERDGRWWFRRGDEELVFDDRTETWTTPEVLKETERQEESVAAAPDALTHPLDEPRPEPEVGTFVPSGSGPFEPAAAPAVETQPVETGSMETRPVGAESASSDERRVITEGPEAASEPVAVHWKCPNCGVVNGSTATSCRMCFAARP